MSWPDDDLPNEWTDDEDLVAADMFARITERLNQLRAAMPKVLSGSVVITPSAANTPTSVNVTFPGGGFAAAPAVTACPLSGVPGSQITGVGVTNITATGCTIWLTRTNTTPGTVGWIAIG